MLNIFESILLSGGIMLAFYILTRIVVRAFYHEKHGYYNKILQAKMDKRSNTYRK